jgi:hypothetical protein
VDGAAANVFHVHRILQERDFDVRVIGAFLGKDLDAEILVDRRAVGADEFLVHVALAIQDHRVGAGAGGIVFQREIGGQDGLPLIAGMDASNRSDSGDKRQNKSAENESLGSIHERELLRLARATGTRRTRRTVESARTGARFSRDVMPAKLPARNVGVNGSRTFRVPFYRASFPAPLRHLLCSFSLDARGTTHSLWRGGQRCPAKTGYSIRVLRGE